MLSPATISTDRLILRPFTLDDAPTVQRYVAEREIAATTAAIPHPYPPGGAAEWIGTHRKKLEDGSGINFAITLRKGGQLVGAIDLRPNIEHQRAEVGYVIYRPWWGNGYATEALRAVIGFGFESLELRRIEAHHFENNPASGKVQLKAGMTFEGRFRKHILKWGSVLDTFHYSILNDEYDAKL